MALFGKSSGNKTLYSKQPYVIRGKRKLNEPIYVCTGTPNMGVVSMPFNGFTGSEVASDRLTELSRKTFSVATGEYNRKKMQTHVQKHVPSAGFVDEWVYSQDRIEEAVFFENINGRGNNDNDVISLNFYLPSYRKQDAVGRFLFTEFCVYIDAADYDKLDIQEFVNRIDQEIKGSNDPRFLLTYPIIWNLPAIQADAKLNGRPWAEMRNYLGVENEKDFPQTIPYDKAIRTKDGRPVIGSILTNPTLKDLKTSKPTTPTQSKPAAPAKIAPAPQPTKTNPNEKRIKELQFELDETKSNIKKLQSKVKTLEAEISSLQQSNSPAPGRK